MGFHRSERLRVRVGDCKSLQSPKLFSLYWLYLNNAVVWMVSIRPPISNFFFLFKNELVNSLLDPSLAKEKKCQRHVHLVKSTFWQTGWLKQWRIKCVKTKVYVGKCLLSERSVLVSGGEPGSDHPEWNWAGEVGIMLKYSMTQLKRHNWWCHPTPFYSNQRISYNILDGLDSSSDFQLFQPSFQALGNRSNRDGITVILMSRLCLFSGKVKALVFLFAFFDFHSVVCWDYKVHSTASRHFFR